MSYKNQDWLDKPASRAFLCTDCPRPNGCIDECIIESAAYENIALIRGEDDNELR